MKNLTYANYAFITILFLLAACVTPSATPWPVADEFVVGDANTGMVGASIMGREL